MKMSYNRECVRTMTFVKSTPIILESEETFVPMYILFPSVVSGQG